MEICLQHLIARRGRRREGQEKDDQETRESWNREAPHTYSIGMLTGENRRRYYQET